MTGESDGDFGWRVMVGNDEVEVLDACLVDLQVPDELDVICSRFPEVCYEGSSLPMLNSTALEVLGFAIVVTDGLARRRSHGVQQRGAGEKG